MNIKIRYFFTNLTYFCDYKFLILFNVFDVKVKKIQINIYCFIFQNFNIVQKHVMSWIGMGSFRILMTFCSIGGGGVKRGSDFRWGRDRTYSKYVFLTTNFLFYSTSPVLISSITHIFNMILLQYPFLLVSGHIRRKFIETEGQSCPLPIQINEF